MSSKELLLLDQINNSLFISYSNMAKENEDKSYLKPIPPPKPRFTGVYHIEEIIQINFS